jgi:hypothetical protein
LSFLNQKKLGDSFGLMCFFSLNLTNFFIYLKNKKLFNITKLQKKNCGGGVIGRGEGKYATKVFFKS